MDQAAEPVASDDLDVGVYGIRERPERTGVVQCPMRPVPVEMGLILGQDLAQVRGVDDKHPVEDLVAHAACPAFHDRVHAGRLGRGEHDPDARGAEHFVEHRRELGVAVTDQEFEVACVVAQVEHQVAGLLGDPCGGRVRGDTQDPDAAGGVLDDGEAVQPGQGDRVGMEEITGQDFFGLGPQELPPARS